MQILTAVINVTRQIIFWFTLLNKGRDRQQHLSFLILETNSVMIKNLLSVFCSKQYKKSNRAI